MSRLFSTHRGEAGGVVRQKVEALGVRVHTGAKILEIASAEASAEIQIR